MKMGRKKSNHKEYVPDTEGNGTGKWAGKTLSGMRELAFGNDAEVALHQQAVRSDSMRNDQQLLDDAAAKRQRKADKVKALLAKQQGNGASA